MHPSIPKELRGKLISSDNSPSIDISNPITRAAYNLAGFLRGAVGGWIGWHRSHLRRGLRHRRHHIP